MKNPYYKHNRLQQLRGFYHTVREGSISKAAQRMMLSQPSVSLQIQALERELDAVLFERSGPKIKLTPDGQLLYSIAADLVDRFDSLDQSFTAMRGQVETGTLNIAAGESTILYLLPGYVRAFADALPRVELKLHNVTGRTGLAMLRAGEVDFAVGSMIDVPDDILYDPLFTYDPMLITPRNHPLTHRRSITLKAISAYPLILPPHQLTTWRIVDSAFKQQHLSYHLRVEVGGWEVIKKYVTLGLGVSIVTSICLTGKEKLAAFSVAKFLPKRTYGVVLRRGKFLSPQARRFIETMIPTGVPPNVY